MTLYISESHRFPWRNSSSLLCMLCPALCAVTLLVLPSFVMLLCSLSSSPVPSHPPLPQTNCPYLCLPSYGFLQTQLSQEPLLLFLSWFWKPCSDDLALFRHPPGVPYLQYPSQSPPTAVIPNSHVLKELGLSCYTGHRAGNEGVEESSVGMQGITSAMSTHWMLKTLDSGLAAVIIYYFLCLFLKL